MVVWSDEAGVALGLLRELTGALGGEKSTLGSTLDRFNLEQTDSCNGFIQGEQSVRWEFRIYLFETPPPMVARGAGGAARPHYQRVPVPPCDSAFGFET